MRKRSDFKGDIYNAGYETQQVNILGETIWDVQVGYDFGEAFPTNTFPAIRYLSFHCFC